MTLKQSVSSPQMERPQDRRSMREIEEEIQYWILAIHRGCVNLSDRSDEEEDEERSEESDDEEEFLPPSSSDDKSSDDMMEDEEARKESPCQGVQQWFANFIQQFFAE